MKLEYITIHNAIHTPEQTHVAVHGVALPINKAANGCRYVDYYDGDQKITIRFIEQNKKKALSPYAKRALDGEKITWGMRPGEWILIDKSTSRLNPFQQQLRQINEQL